MADYSTNYHWGIPLRGLNPYYTSFVNLINEVDQAVYDISLELSTARGSMPSLGARLDVSLNPDGTLKSGIVINSLAVWTTATRPSPPAAGNIGYNADANMKVVEYYSGTQWVTL
jgi:hypothetical protein